MAVPSSRSSSDAVSDIGPGLWLENPANGHGYTVTDNWSSFAEYEGQAVAWGGHLVTINDQAEQDWLYDNFGPVGYLIGFNDIEEEGSFVWVSGQPVSYTNWCDGEPNNFTGVDPAGENVVSMVLDDAQCWNDVPSTGPGIVEADSPPPPHIRASASNSPRPRRGLQLRTRHRGDPDGRHRHRPHRRQ